MWRRRCLARYRHGRSVISLNLSDQKAGGQTAKTCGRLFDPTNQILPLRTPQHSRRHVTAELMAGFEERKGLRERPKR
jgi:hypothetical protein